MKSIVIGLAVLAVIVIVPLVYSAVRPQSTIQPEPLKFMENVQRNEVQAIEAAKGLSIRIHSAQAWASENQFAHPKAGSHFYAVDLEIANVGTTPANVNPFSVRLLDADGRSYMSAAFGPMPSLDARMLGAGQLMRGWLCFEVIDGAVPNAIEFIPGISGHGAVRAEL